MYICVMIDPPTHPSIHPTPLSPPSHNPNQVIVDLRGPQAKLLTRLDEINYEMEVYA